jgi:hypothetical protein
LDGDKAQRTRKYIENQILIDALDHQ